MATAKFDIKTEALKPVLAYVGVTDLAVEVVREAVADVGEDGLEGLGLDVELGGGHVDLLLVGDAGG